MNSTAMTINGQQRMDVAQLQVIEQSTPAQKQTENLPVEEKTPQASSQMTAQDVKDVLESFQDLSKTIQTKLNFSVSKENNEIIVKVIDRESNQLIRQFPSEEMLNLQDKMRDMAGFLLNANA